MISELLWELQDYAFASNGNAFKIYVQTILKQEGLIQTLEEPWLIYFCLHKLLLLLSSSMVSFLQIQARRTSISFRAWDRFPLRMHYVFPHNTSYAHTVLEHSIQGKFSKETVQMIYWTSYNFTLVLNFNHLFEIQF